MLVGFDMDSVLCNSDITLLRMIDQMTPEQRESIEEWYYLDREPKLNPEDFLGENDEYIIITGRSKKVELITHEWVDKYCANCKQIFMVDLGPAYNCSNVKSYTGRKSKLGAKPK